MCKNTVNILNFIVYAFLKTFYQVDHYIFELYIRKCVCDITFKFILLNKNFTALFFFVDKSKYEDTCKKSSIDKKNHQTPTKYIKATIL